jgi:hypothetical protein
MYSLSSRSGKIADGCDIDKLAPDFFRAQLVDPKILRDAVHPAVETGVRPPLIEMGQSAGVGFLHQILTEIPIVGERAREPAQLRQEFDHLTLQIGVPAVVGLVRFNANSQAAQIQAGWRALFDEKCGNHPDHGRLGRFHLGRAPCLNEAVLWHRSHPRPKEP